jgi:hypothetical protein
MLAGMARDDSKSGGRLEQIKLVYSFTRERDPQILLWIALPAIAIFAVLLALGFVFGHPIYLGVIGFIAALLWMTSIFGRRSMSAQYASVEGQPGAAAAVLSSLRGTWKVQPAVALNRNQDLVHRAVGRPGIVLVGEGAPSRVGPLIAQERKRVTRIAGDIPIYEVQVGAEEGQVDLRKLQAHLVKLPRNLKPREVDAVDNRLRALGGAAMPVPKGPLPRGGRIPRGKMR